MKTFTLRDERIDTSTVFCGEGVLSLVQVDHALIFTDETVYGLYRDLIHAAFKSAPVHTMSAGEAFKTPETLLALLGAMAQAELKRKDVLVCLGGGVVGDIGGLAAALYMRGITCVQIPTTLLSQVDSSVGGKTAVDFAGIKNLIGTFRQPQSVYADPLFLKTLPVRELRCGLGEIVKHGALNVPLFKKLCTQKGNLLDLEFLSEIIPDNIQIKADIVRRDAREQNLRKCLNLGHTTGHAFELSDKKLSHGEYVLVGILFESELAMLHTACDNTYLRQLQSLCIDALGEIPSLVSAEQAAPLARLDKKNASEEIAIVAPKAPGEYAVLSLPYAVYEKELEKIRRELC